MAINNTPDEQNIEGVRGRPATPEEIAQRDGYVRGRQDESHVQRDLRDRDLREYDRVIAQSRANDNAASGVVFGIAIAVVAAGVGIAAYFLLGGNDNSLTPAEAPPVQRETVIERETIIERPNAAPAESLPDVQIDVPDVNTVNEAPADADVQTQPEPAADPTAETEAAPADAAE